MRSFTPILLSTLLALGFGCNQGTEVGTTFSQNSGGSGPGGGGQGGKAGAGGDAASSTTAAASTASASSSAGTGGAGEGGSSTSAGGGPACSYAAANTCQTPEMIPAIDGDQNSDTRVVKGTTARWFLIQVNEAVSSVLTYPQLSFTATIDSAPGMDWDLWVYPGNALAPTCGGAPIHALGSPEEVTRNWGDTKGTDDTQVFTLEVRYASGTECGPAAGWTLTVQGHTVP